MVWIQEITLLSKIYVFVQCQFTINGKSTIKNVESPKTIRHSNRDLSLPLHASWCIHFLSFYNKKQQSLQLHTTADTVSENTTKDPQVQTVLELHNQASMQLRPI